MSLVIGLALCAFGSLLAVAGVRRLGTAVSLYRTDAVPLRNVPETDVPVEFEGRAQSPADEPLLEAPFSGDDALCCEVWMETESRHRTDVDGLEVGDAKEPETYRNTEQSQQLAETDGFRRPFIVTDGGARVAVDPANADLDITGHMRCAPIKCTATGRKTRNNQEGQNKSVHPIVKSIATNLNIF